MSGRNGARNIVLAGSLALLLGACSWLESWPPGEDLAEAPPPQQPQMKIVQNADNTWMRPAEGAQPLEHLSPPAEPGRTEAMERLENLEGEVAALRNELKMLMPALTRLAGVGQGLPQDGGAAAAAIAPQAGTPGDDGVYPVPQPAQDVPDYSAAGGGMQETPPVTASGASITNLRVGEHTDKTRLVFDLSADVSFRYDVDNGEKIMTVEFPGAGWTAHTQQSLDSSPLVASYQVAPDGHGGTRAAIQLRQPVRVVMAQALPGAAGLSPRIVIDLSGT